MMARFGIFCPPGKGHLHTMLSIARRLQQHQHGAVFFQLPYLEHYVKSASPGIEFCGIGDRLLTGARKQVDQQLSQLSGRSALRLSVKRFLPYAEVFLQEASQAVQNAKVDVLLVDQLEVYGGTIAERLSIPFITIASALPLNAESGVPPPVTGWTYSRNPFAKLRNIAGHRFFSKITSPARELLNKYRVLWGLQPLSLKWSKREETYSKLAQISQLPQCLDFPRRKLPENFYTTGLIIDEGIRGNTPFPWELLDGRPVIYACLGTEVNSQARVFRTIAEACSGLNAQLVISLGGGILSEADLGSLPGCPVVVKYAPQDEILKRTILLITHGGLNTALEAVGYGVPMVIIPIAWDQLGVAARIAWHRLGEVMPLKKLSATRLRRKITRVLNEPGYREKAQHFKSQLGTRKGVELACEIIERTLARQAVPEDKACSVR
jgi:zeaxanthin glucosyltransferase